MQKSVRILAALVLIGAGIWAWRVLFPSPEVVIQRRIAALAKVASFPAHEGTLGRVADVDRLTGFFTPDVVLTADVPGHGTHTIDNRPDLLQAAMALRSNLDGLKIEFLDVNVKLGADKQTATADLTAKASVPGQSDFQVQEFNFMFKKVDGKWRIYRIESVKTLSGSVEGSILTA